MRSSSSVPRASIRSMIVVVALLGGLAACGSGDESADDVPADDGETDAVPADDGGANTESAGGSDDTGASTDGGVATLTMGDGTVYEFALSTCETSATDADFVLPNSYDVSGATADGTEFFVGRAGLDESFVAQSGAMEVPSDADNPNAGLLYTASLGDGDLLTVDGATVSGAFTMKAFGSVRPHGDQSDVVLDVRC